MGGGGRRLQLSIAAAEARAEGEGEGAPTWEKGVEARGTRGGEGAHFPFRCCHFACISIILPVYSTIK